MVDKSKSDRRSLHPGPPFSINTVNTVAYLYPSQLLKSGDHGDYQRSIDCYRKAWEFRSENPWSQIALASTLGARLSLLSGEEEATADFLEEAVQLLPTTCPRSMSDTDTQAHLQQRYGLGSSAAAACLNAGRSPSHALEVLEAGRGVVASLLLDMRSVLSDLRQKHPDLAERFETLGEMLNFKSNVGEDWRLSTEAEDSHLDSSQASRRIRLHKEFDELVQTIRNQVGFSKFLLPLSADEMMVAAHAGPIVIINISHIRCDAIIIEPQRIRAIPLEQLKYREVEERSSSLLASSSYRVYSSEFLVPLLEWMWRAAARPVLDELGITRTPEGDDWPHIWWIPTGGMTHLPIHAAGLQGRGAYETVIDRVISSYATSVKSLVHNRR